MTLNPLTSVFNTVRYLIKGRLYFPRNRIGQVLVTSDGRRFTIFREAIVDPVPGQRGSPQATFIVRFHVANVTPRANKLFSLVPIPFFIGLPGFRHKLWTWDEQSGDFQGVYQWDTVRDAENYAGSFAMRFMTRRSVPGSVSYQILPSGSSSKYVIERSGSNE